MAHVPPRAASPLFLTEPEIRRGIELLHHGYAQLMRGADARLAQESLGRAHQRALYWIARRPGLTVGDLLVLLGVTKQSLGRTVDELKARALIEVRPGDRDRRQRLLRTTEIGAALERELFAGLSARLADAYSSAGQEAVGGFWAVLEGLAPPALVKRA
jgi:DNA-binding MarR family transcriptional regulator